MASCAFLQVVGHEIPPEVEAIGEGEKSIARIGYTAECEAAVNEQIRYGGLRGDAF